MSGLGPQPRDPAAPLRWLRRASLVIGVVGLAVGAILLLADNDYWWVALITGGLFLLDVAILGPVIRRAERGDV